MDPGPSLSSPVLADSLAFGGPAMALELLDLFAGVLDECLGAIAATPADAPPSALREPAHKLKGSAAMFGDEALSAAAARLEAATVASDPAAAAAARSALDEEAGRARTRLAADRALLASSL